MALDVPLGVRIYSPALSLDQWVTKNVEGVSYRSGAPGGFLDATIRFRRFTPIQQPDALVWNPATSGASVSNDTFLVTDANATAMAVGDRFWVYDGGGNIRMNGDRFTVTGLSSASGTTTVSYAPRSNFLIAAGDSVVSRKPAAYYDSQLTGFNRMINLFNRIQIVDLRTAEICWEGRIEDPARETDRDTWTLGCLGTTAFATDINRPLFYLDDQVENWYRWGIEFFDFDSNSSSVDSTSAMIRVVFSPDDIPYDADTNKGFIRIAFSWQGVEATEQEGVGRFDAIADGNDSSSVIGKLGITLKAYLWADNVPAPLNVFPGQAWASPPSDSENLAAYPLTGAANFHFNKVIGTHFKEGVYRMGMAGGYLPDTGVETINNSTQTWGSWRLPRVQAERMDRFGVMLNTGASYPDGALKVGPIVEDVVGRFLNTRFQRAGTDIPYAGWINPNTAYIDKTSSVLMVAGWSFYDGVTAKEILDKCINEAQPNAYWGIWESTFGATDSTAQSKYRFAYETWPDSWGYMLTSADGFTEQPNGENTYSQLWYIWSWGNNEIIQGNGKTWRHIQAFWNTDLGSDLDANKIVRGQTVIRGSTYSDYNGDVFDEAGKWIVDNSHTINSGQIKIARPVAVYDKGLNGPYGLARTFDPWMVRPGKLCRVMDVLPATSMNDFAYGSGGKPNRGFDNCIFRMAVTEYDSESNTCTVDLDEPASWYVPQQIVTPPTKVQGVITAYR